MAYTVIPTRTTADPNSASDVNQLMTNIAAVKVIADAAGGGGVTSVTFTLDGVSQVGEDQLSFMIPATATIADVYIKADTAPTGASLIVDVNKNGTTIFTTQASRPEIAISATSDTSAAPDVTSLAANDILSVSVDQIGSTISGGDNLYIRVNYA